jgi:hypothetical protein
MTTVQRKRKKTLHKRSGSTGDEQQGMVEDIMTDLDCGKKDPRTPTIRQACTEMFSADHKKAKVHNRIEVDDESEPVNIYHTSAGSKGKGTSTTIFYYVNNNNEFGVVALGYHAKGDKTSSRYYLERGQSEPPYREGATVGLSGEEGD